MVRKSIFLSGEELEIFERIPLGERSKIIQKALREYDEEMKKPFHRDDLKDALEIKIRQKNHYDYVVGEMESILHDICGEIDEIKTKLDSGRNSDIEEKHLIDANEFWRVFIESAQLHLDEKIVFDENYPIKFPTGRVYCVLDIVGGSKVRVERWDSKSPKPSTFTFSTIERAVRRLNKEGGRVIDAGIFMPVLAQECTVVELHPHLMRVGKVIHYSEEGFNEL